MNYVHVHNIKPIIVLENKNKNQQQRHNYNKKKKTVSILFHANQPRHTYSRYVNTITQHIQPHKHYTYTLQLTPARTANLQK